MAGGVVYKVIFMSNPTIVLKLCCVVFGVVTIVDLTFPGRWFITNLSSSAGIQPGKYRNNKLGLSCAKFSITSHWLGARYLLA